MANCYHCASKGASYRRYVNSGYSYGGWVSNRSHGTSSRSYYGLRTLCESCAARVDKWRNIKWSIALLIIAIILLANL
jgi:hypothetical protein